MVIRLTFNTYIGLTSLNPMELSSAILQIFEEIGEVVREDPYCLLGR